MGKKKKQEKWGGYRGGGGDRKKKRGEKRGRKVRVEKEDKKEMESVEGGWPRYFHLASLEKPTILVAHESDRSIIISRYPYPAGAVPASRKEENRPVDFAGFTN
ncbi:hypothetical protein HZH68_001469 [Vespula germanica]|uniref:Uncharacterized protein n=1 Tax=Vespula germanica TaxID=30212 RepID=A0A834U6V4_VESGE|nr:hypothetical protein HZH68_001469 [Vespula germanica]